MFNFSHTAEDMHAQAAEYQETQAMANSFAEDAAREDAREAMIEAQGNDGVTIPIDIPRPGIDWCPV